MVQILHPKIFIYSCVNLPLVLSKLLQAQLRNVAGSLELDQMIQDAATVSVICELLFCLADGIQQPAPAVAGLTDESKMSRVSDAAECPHRVA